MRILFSTLILLFNLSVVGQTHCDGMRYIDTVFTEIDSTIGVEFGENTTIGGNPITLRMDVYYPESEFFFQRPVVVLSFGGSFLVGNRKQLRPFCMALAHRGYVAATIDYRLFDAFALPLDSLLAFDVAIKATSDMKAAVRWFRESASVSNDFGIDSTLIYAGGISAGSITALHLAYLDEDDYEPESYFDSIITVNGGIRGNSSTNYSYSDEVRGVLNLSGALKDARWIDPGEPVVYSVHDEFDGVVPYDRDISTAIGTPVELWGSLEIDREAREDGIRSHLVTFEGSTDHVSYILNGPQTEEFRLVVDEGSRFLEYDICDRAAMVSELVKKSSFNVFPNPTSRSLSLSGVPLTPFRILDASGAIIEEVSTTDLEAIDVSHLSSGHYYLIGQGEKGETLSIPFIKE